MRITIHYKGGEETRDIEVHVNSDGFYKIMDIVTDEKNIVAVELEQHKKLIENYNKAVRDEFTDNEGGWVQKPARLRFQR